MRASGTEIRRAPELGCRAGGNGALGDADERARAEDLNQSLVARAIGLGGTNPARPEFTGDLLTGSTGSDSMIGTSGNGIDIIDRQRGLHIIESTVG